MAKVASALRWLGILLLLWVGISVAGLASGVVDFGTFMTGRRPRIVARSTRTADAGVPTDAGTRRRARRRDAGASVVVPEAAPLTPVSAERWIVCPSAIDPSLSAAQLFGDERPELVVGCQGRWEVIAITDQGPARIAVFTAPDPPAPDQRPRTGPASVGDVDGDGLFDLVLPLAFGTDQGATRGGGLYWVPLDAFGGIREPITLAPIAAVDAAIAAIDAQAGAEIAVINRANTLAQLPSEAWVFGGGAAPARTAALPIGLGGISVRIVDMDRDGRSDIVALADGRVTLLFGDAEGGFGRAHTFELEGAREIAIGDLDTDGGTDLAVLGNALVWIRAGALDAMEPHGLDGVPANLRGLALIDIDADNKLDFVGWDHPNLFVLHQSGELSFAPETRLVLAGTELGPRRHAIVDLDLDGQRDDLVLLGTSAEDGPLELLWLAGAMDGVELTPSTQATDIPDAPLVLRAALPGAG